ncbi:MAG TPA: aldehyde dehydrogenase family protein, partial [Solirubrobacterales bacterium]|nr:aldehyde dehydrogenase family protein [Solirubrobacterales bacterium]
MTVITETGTTTMKNYVGGQWVDAEGAELHDVINPATGEAIARVPFSSAAHLDDAVRSAREALPAWRGVSTIARARMLFTLREKLEARKHEIARLVAPQPLHGADH